MCSIFCVLITTSVIALAIMYSCLSHNNLYQTATETYQSDQQFYQVPNTNYYILHDHVMFPDEMKAGVTDENLDVIYRHVFVCLDDCKSSGSMSYDWQCGVFELSINDQTNLKIPSTSKTASRISVTSYHIDPESKYYVSGTTDRGKLVVQCLTETLDDLTNCIKNNQVMSSYIIGAYVAKTSIGAVLGMVLIGVTLAFVLVSFVIVMQFVGIILMALTHPRLESRSM